ncbi:DUF6607 family protein [Nitrospirillum viridazoti]|uniref:DUF6607 family protein n=1 Tax=Nitrospirillum viridazoti TaxID=3144925 RepID=UPI0011ADD91E|nr:DUF6607 family protein [Nitrospirillum amazonense]TWB39919.1 hypothetical protein FBZ91_105153 [Nitrospirillum amazonense]
MTLHDTLKTPGILKTGRRTFLTGAALLGVTAHLPLAARAAETAAPSTAAPEQDRKAILAMAGTYKVTFDFRETTPFLADYKPIAPKVSGGDEVVRVVEDTGSIIRLQHILVVDGEDGLPVVVKHWRQDWVHQPATVLTYQGTGHWSLTPVEGAAARGAWSQTVWQTDDSPRYGGVGRWRHDAGVSRWTSDETWRPLARRDATRHPPYDRYSGTNRHALTPAGWVHEQDNAKIGPRDGTLVTFVHETVVNTYNRSDDFPVAAAEEYWARTSTYWAAVRAAWDQAIARHQGVSVTEEANNGSVTGKALMGLADTIAKGDKSTPDAVAEARRVIADATQVPAKSGA